jgi:hypothetical protein
VFGLSVDVGGKQPNDQLNPKDKMKAAFPNDLFLSRGDCVAAIKDQAATLAAMAQRDNICPKQGQRWAAATLAAEIGASISEAEALIAQ